MENTNNTPNRRADEVVQIGPNTWIIISHSDEKPGEPITEAR